MSRFHIYIMTMKSFFTIFWKGQQQVYKTGSYNRQKHVCGTVCENYHHCQTIRGTQTSMKETPCHMVPWHAYQDVIKKPAVNIMTNELCTALNKIMYYKMYCNLINKLKVTKKTTVSFVTIWCSRGHPEFSGQAVSHLQTDQVEAHCYLHIQHTPRFWSEKQKGCSWMMWLNTVLTFCFCYFDKIRK